MWTPVRIVYKGNFKNFFQMIMLFLVYVVSFLGQLHFMRNYFFTVNISAQRLLLQSNQFDTTVIFSEQLLFQNAYFFSAITLSKQLLNRSKNSINSSSLGQLVFQNSYYSGRQICSEYRYLQENVFFEAGTSTKNQIFPDFRSFTVYAKTLHLSCLMGF